MAVGSMEIWKAGSRVILVSALIHPFNNMLDQGAGRKARTIETLQQREKTTNMPALGKNHKLAVIVRSFSPRNVLCTGWNNAPPFASCRNIMGGMLTDTVPRRFGRAHSPGRELITPYSLESRKFFLLLVTSFLSVPPHCVISNILTPAKPGC